MNAEWIALPTADGQTFDGYLSHPPTGDGPGIVLIQEIWGVNHHIRTVADQYALAGYTVLAPDVFWRLEARVDLAYDEAGSARARALAQALDRDQATADLADAVQALQDRDDVTGGTAVLGYCLGGQLAYRIAATGTPDAAVAFYGGKTVNHLDEAARITQPILFHHGGLDQSIPPEDVAAIKAAFAGRDNARFFDYPDAGHGFNCWGRPLYHQRAAALAHGRSLAFLAEVL